jgi:hypothetical protein
MSTAAQPARGESLYLVEHGIEQAIKTAVAAILQDQPSEPLKVLGELLITASMPARRHPTRSKDGRSALRRSACCPSRTCDAGYKVIDDEGQEQIRDEARAPFWTLLGSATPPPAARGAHEEQGRVVGDV